MAAQGRRQCAELAPAGVGLLVAAADVAAAYVEAVEGAAQGQTIVP